MVKWFDKPKWNLWKSILFMCVGGLIGLYQSFSIVSYLATVAGFVVLGSYFSYTSENKKDSFIGLVIGTLSVIILGLLII